MQAIFASLLVLGASVGQMGDSAMNSTGGTDRCEVIGGEKLSGEFVGGRVICGEVERAIAAQARTEHYSAQIKVLSPTRLAGTLVVNGRLLPVQNFAVMDGKLSMPSIRRFASALATAVAEASKS